MFNVGLMSFSLDKKNKHLTLDQTFLTSDIWFLESKIRFHFATDRSEIVPSLYKNRENAKNKDSQKFTCNMQRVLQAVIQAVIQAVMQAVLQVWIAVHSIRKVLSNLMAPILSKINLPKSLDSTWLSLDTMLQVYLLLSIFYYHLDLNLRL